ncbi:MAG: nucleotidyltransferase family protein [Oscillospiraceae bacterium]|jgi:predicted nucleotidyltransferase|nr:nucleotidyltransferase family protein [Oscillospiraceae bacterium]
MDVAGIICEYNPFHSGHAAHIARTRSLLGGASAIVCCMSGNFVQRGELAVMGKHARAEAAVLCGADLVIELPLPCALSSAERFALGGVRMLDALGVCGYLSFGSESGDLALLESVRSALDTAHAEEITKRELARGKSYAAARAAAVAEILGYAAPAPGAPNDMLGVEYLRAIAATGARLTPIAVPRAAGAQASAIREQMRTGVSDWTRFVPAHAAEIFARELAAGRAPVPASGSDAAALSRLRALRRDGYLSLPDASDGAGERLMRYARREPSLLAIAERTKTKRYVMSRIKRMIMCACLGIKAGDADASPGYIRVLAANGTGTALLREINKQAAIPVITKPAAAKRLPGRALEQFQKTAAATDFYVLSHPAEPTRRGGQEWTMSPVILQ